MTHKQGERNITTVDKPTTNTHGERMTEGQWEVWLYDNLGLPSAEHSMMLAKHLAPRIAGKLAASAPAAAVCKAPYQKVGELPGESLGFCELPKGHDGRHDILAATQPVAGEASGDFECWWLNVGYHHMPKGDQPPEHAAIAKLSWDAARAAQSTLNPIERAKAEEVVLAAKCCGCELCVFDKWQEFIDNYGRPPLCKTRDRILAYGNERVLEEAKWWRDSYSQMGREERMEAYNSRHVRIAELQAACAKEP